MNTYKRDYVDACRSRMEAQLAAYKALRGSVCECANGHRLAVDAAFCRFEPMFFNSLVVVLDGFFVHRSRTIEGKDGNPLNEFRMICTSLLENDGVMCTSKTNNKTIKYNLEESVIGLRIGERIGLSEPAFTALFEAFFAEIEARFT